VPVDESQSAYPALTHLRQLRKLEAPPACEHGRISGLPCRARPICPRRTQTHRAYWP
jgi:ribosome modulation factor